MAQCTAPIRGHRTAAAAAACPVCGGRRSYYQFGYNTYPSFSVSLVMKLFALRSSSNSISRQPDSAASATAAACEVDPLA